MRFCLTTLLSVAAAAVAVHAWETTADAAQQARALLTDPTVYGVGTLSSIYSDDFRIPALRGRVASGPEYFASCEENGDLILMALTVSQNWRNILPSLHGTGNATLSIAANPSPDIPDPRHSRPSKHTREWDPHRPHWRRGMPSKNRIALFGTVEELHDGKPATAAAAECFLSTHPDARHWAPGAPDSPHTALWVRFRVAEVYSIGGYGDEHKIAFLPLEEYRRAGQGRRQGQGHGQGYEHAARDPVDAALLFGDSVPDVLYGADEEDHHAPLLRFQSPQHEPARTQLLIDPSARV